MNSKTVPFKQPTNTRPLDQWVDSRATAAAAGPTKRLTVDISTELHKRLKVHCATAGLQISDVVRDLLERAYPA